MLTNRLTGQTWAGCYTHAAWPLSMLIVSQSNKHHHCLVSARSEPGVILSLAGPASPRMGAWSSFPSSTPARPAVQPPPPATGVSPGCGNPIANLAHVIRRPVRLLSALPSFFSLCTLIETGTPRPRVPLLPSPGPGYAQPIPLPNCLPPRGQPDAPSYHQPYSCVCPELTASVGCGRRDCGSIGEENGQTVASLTFLFGPVSQTAVFPYVRTSLPWPQLVDIS